MCEIRVSEEPWSLWALMEKRCKNSCKMSNEGCKMTTKWHKMTATWQHSSAQQPEGDRKAPLNYQKNNRAQDSDLNMDHVCVRHLLSSSEQRRAHHLEPLSHHACERRRPRPSFVLANVHSCSCPWRWRALWHKAEQILTIRRSVNRREAGHRSAAQQVIVTPPPHHDWFIHKPWSSQPQALSRGSCVTAEKRHPQENTGRRRTQRATLPQPPSQAALVLHHFLCVLTSFQPAHNRFRFLKADSEKAERMTATITSTLPAPVSATVWWSAREDAGGASEALCHKIYRLKINH